MLATASLCPVMKTQAIRQALFIVPLLRRLVMSNQQWKINPIKAGEFGPMPDWMGYRNGKEADYGYNIPSIIYLLQNGNRNVLVDTSFSSVEDVRQNMGIYCNRQREIDFLLKDYNVKVEQIDTVILTHLHWDHAGNLDLFPDAKIICQKAEDVWLAKTHKWEIGYPQWFVRTLAKNKERLTFVEGDAVILDGLEVWWHGGHTPGSQMVAVHTQNGLGVITGDNVMTYDNIDKNIPVGLFCSIHQCLAAMERIKEKADFFIPSHDWKVFQK